MKVMKFGGTSVGSVESILSVKRIVEKEKDPVIVVVSALVGVTDKLIALTDMAVRGENYETEFDAVVKRHFDVIKGVMPASKADTIQDKVRLMFDELLSVYRKATESKQLSQETKDLIVSFGERVSSIIMANVIEGAAYAYSPDFIKTNSAFGKHTLDIETTNALILNFFPDKPVLTVCPGFIATDKDSGVITNLGRGGSDYTAAILAAALHAEKLEIWTDVDGFMTADPRVISKAYVIDNLSYIEAMELCNYGAKVIYPPTIFPAYHENIPILIKNTFNPEAPGTYISCEKDMSNQPVKGISSINDTALVTMQGLGMVGVIGVSKRLFGALANMGVSAFFISQASSENTISIGVTNAEADLATKVIADEFAHELAIGEINSVQAEKDLATIAVVGDNMKRTPGISGKLFGALGRSGVNVVAIAQGASETNISFVIDSKSLRKALNVIHEVFFLSEYQELNIFLVGTGTVGGGLLDQIMLQQPKLRIQNNLNIKVVGVADENKVLFNRDGVALSNYREVLAADGISSSPEVILNGILEMNIFNSVFVDCTASYHVAALYKELLLHNVSVVAANKITASGDYATYAELKDIARKKGIKFLFETNVGAGLPIINTMNNLVNSGDKILKLEAVLSGTLNFIFNTISAEIPLSKAIKMAKEARYAEPDPRIDLSGTDVIRKLVILTREAGYKVEQSDVKKNLFIPQRYFEGTLDDFWNTIHEMDAEFESIRQRLDAERKRYRFVATMENGDCLVGLQEVDMRHPFYELEGSNNIIMIKTERYYDYPMIIKGYGAGASVTAAGVFADIMSIANIR
ncbi:MAG: bifunctional aspartate kinase/homoserine dehydrogenase I [Paludibacter sp.]|nr:bifunctional aspartate kinase/homoserine dehydrogenase I [Paludibacter sp.]MDD4199521.1 bifunctional aspartate kinase/homoserine dehydrogenase I [Paludibacter sp.]MDD4428373.1 bifunctional aspartate kinase/homoserine dehydrogenase I [Paludibacter sp.]